MLEHCATLLEEEEHTDENYMLSLLVIKNTGVDFIEFKNSFNTILDEYYHWLEIAIKEEKFELAAKIRECIDIQVKHYIRMGKDLFNEKIKTLTTEYNNKKITELNKNLDLK